MTRGEVMGCEYARESGVYVLGSLAPAERTAYERHMSVCGVCREAVAEVAVLPGLLGRLDAAAASQIAGEDGPDAPESRLPKLIEAAALSRRRDARSRRWRATGLVAAAAAVAAVVGLGLGPGLRSDDPDGGQPQVALAAMSEVRETQVSAEIGLTSFDGGTQVVMHCAWQRTGATGTVQMYRLFAVGKDGTDEQVASWMAGPGTDLTLSGVTRYGSTGIERLELRRSSGEPLLVFDPQ